MAPSPTYVRAPDHLGDGVLALPAVAALAALGPLQIKGPGWVGTLYRGLGEVVETVPRAERGVLFKPAFRAAWEARRVRHLVGTPTDLRGLLLGTAVPAHPGHRSEQYAAIAGAVGAEVVGDPAFMVTPEEAARAPELPAGAVLLLPGSASGPVVQWGGYRALADALEGRAVFAGGPAEEPWLAKLAGPHPVLPTLGLGELAAVMARAARVAANDSGLTHLAAAARRGNGADPADVIVIYGSTVPERTGPPGSTALLGPRVACAPCYAKTCAFQLECLDIPVERVQALLG